MTRKLIFIALASLQLMACSTSYNSKPAQPSDAPATVAEFPDYLIQPGDELDIRFFGTPELDQIVTVRPDGRIALPLIPAIRVNGFTPEQLDEQLTEKYSEQLISPDINVNVKSFAGQKVYIGGEVKKPGVFEISSPITVIEAAILAGGFTPGSNTNEILVIRRGADNRPYSIRVNAGNTLAGNAVLSEVLKAADVVYVPRSRIANANLFIEQYIRGLLMFDGFRISFGYDLDDPSSSSR